MLARASAFRAPKLFERNKPRAQAAVLRDARPNLWGCCWALRRQAVAHTLSKPSASKTQGDLAQSESASVVDVEQADKSGYESLQSETNWRS